MKYARMIPGFVLMLALFMVSVPLTAKGGGGGPPACSVGTPTNPAYTAVQTPANADTYHTIIDHTQAGHPNVIVSNTETLAGKKYPKTGGDPNPWAAINGDIDTTAPSTDKRVRYHEVKMNDADLTNAGLTVTTTATQGIGTYVHRLGSWNGGPGITALEIAPAGSGTFEKLMTAFDPTVLNGQAFDLDRLRYVANKLWKKWKLDVAGNKGWFTKFQYQPTGTMSFEQFLYNIKNGKPMFGIVRVMLPMKPNGSKWDVEYDSNQPVNGNEFTIAHTWTATPPTKTNELNGYYGVSTTCSKTIEVYGMLMYDYVDETTYDPDNFETGQDYTDNAVQGADNQILPRSSSKNVYMKVFESILINPVNDKLMGDASTAGRDFRMDSLETARGYMIATSGSGGVQTDMLASDVPDAYVWEYWMRVAAKAGSSSATYTAIVSDLASQYDVITESFNAGASRRSDFDNTVWPSLATKDQYHAYFPNAYERGWMVAFDALDLDANEWKDLPGSAASTIDGDAVSIPFPAKTGAPAPTTYPSFKVPGDTLAIDVYNGTIPYSLAGIVDADPNPKDIPNFFLGSWEDLPALSFAGGVLDMHGHANISGMLYTPDSSEIEAKKDKYAPFQYANGALLVGNGIYLEDGGTGDHSMIGIVFNDHTFDHLRSKASFNIHGPKTVREIMGQ